MFHTKACILHVWCICVLHYSRYSAANSSVSHTTIGIQHIILLCLTLQQLFNIQLIYVSHYSRYSTYGSSVSHTTMGVQHMILLCLFTTIGHQIAFICVSHYIHQSRKLPHLPHWVTTSPFLSYQNRPYRSKTLSLLGYLIWISIDETFETVISWLYVNEKYLFGIQFQHIYSNNTCWDEYSQSPPVL